MMVQSADVLMNIYGLFKIGVIDSTREELVNTERELCN